MAKRAIGCLFFVLILGFAGVYIGMRSADRRVQGIDNPWLSIPLPSGVAPASFIEGEGSYAYIRSTDSRIFYQELDSYRNPVLWQEIDAIIPETVMDSRIAAGSCTPVPVGPHPRWRAAPPSGSIAQINCWHPVNPEHTVDMMFVILDDGDIQQWTRSDPGLGGLGIYLINMAYGAFVGGALGLLVFGVILWVRGRGVAERDRYLVGEIEREASSRPAEPTVDWLERLDDDD